MKFRAFTQDDVSRMNELHHKYFSEFECPDFTNFLCSFVLTDENDNDVMYGGVRALAETILVTDKSVNRHILGKALLDALEVSKFTCDKYNIDLLNVFVKDPVYQRHLIKHGFEIRSGNVLNMRIR